MSICPRCRERFAYPVKRRTFSHRIRPVPFWERRVPYDVEAFAANIKNSSLYSEAAVWCDVAERERLTAFECVEFFLRFVESYAKETGDHIRPYSAETWSKAYDAFCKRLGSQPAYLVTEYE